MNALRLLFYIRGYVNIQISGKFPERFINMCMAQNIYIWNIKKHGSNEFTASVSKRAFTLLKDICEETMTEISILGENGIHLLKQRILLRKSFFIGFFVFVFISIYLCTHIWHIEIKDSELVPKERLIQSLEEAGVKYGTAARNIDPDKVKSEILSREPNLEWIWPEVRGTGVYVDLRDRVPRPEIIDSDTPCNLIASDNGLVTSVIITEGRDLVKKDMYVSKGQLLAGGIMDNSSVGIRYVHSDGKVFADVTESISASGSLEKTVKKKTGGKSIRFTVHAGDKKIVLPKIGKNSKTYIKEEEKYNFKIGTIYFPFSLTKTTFYSAHETTVPVSEKKIIENLKEKLEKDLQNSLKNGIILEKEFNIQKDGKNITATITAKCNKQIAVKQPIEEDTNGTEDN